MHDYNSNTFLLAHKMKIYLLFCQGFHQILIRYGWITQVSRPDQLISSRIRTVVECTCCTSLWDQYTLRTARNASKFSGHLQFASCSLVFVQSHKVILVFSRIDPDSSIRGYLSSLCYHALFEWVNWYWMRLLFQLSYTFFQLPWLLFSPIVQFRI